MDQEYVDELKQLLETAKHPQTISLLQKAVSEAERSPCQPQENGPTMKPIMKSQSRDNSSTSMARITNYGWDQSDKFVKIYINGIPGVKTEHIRSDFNQRYVKVELLDVSGKNYSLNINDLYSDIIPDQCTTKVKSGMVVVSLRTKSSERWQCLTAREKKLKDSKEKKAPKSDDKNEDPTQGIMKLMKQMYDDGDDEMKRTIAKSWQEAQDKKMKGGGLGDI